VSGIDWDDLMKNAGHVGALPADTYDCEVIKAELKNSSNGKPMYNVTFKVMNGPHANATIYNNFVISKENAKAMGFFFRHMAAMGLTTEYFAGKPAPAQVAADLVGRRATIRTKVEEYNGADQTRVSAVLPFAGQAPVTPTASAPPPPAPKPTAAKKEKAAPAPEPEADDDSTDEVGREPVAAVAGKATPPPAPF
jgi:hypothetical protein